MTPEVRKLAEILEDLTAKLRATHDPDERVRLLHVMRVAIDEADRAIAIDLAV